jgi:hypothetical protein
MRLDTSNGATGRQQLLGLRVETVVECGRCGLALMAARRIWASVVAAGRGPTRGEIGNASSQSSDRGHEVSILIAVIGPVGR